MENVVWCWSIAEPEHIVFIFREIHEKEIQFDFRLPNNLNPDYYKLRDNERKLLAYLKYNNT